MLKGIRENRFSPVFIRFSSSSSDSHLYLYDPIHLTASTFCFASLKIEMHSQDRRFTASNDSFLVFGCKYDKSTNRKTIALSGRRSVKCSDNVSVLTVCYGSHHSQVKMQFLNRILLQCV